MSLKPDLPQEIYYVKGSRPARPYANVAHLKSALKTRWGGYGKELRIYVVAINGLVDACLWEDVTSEFLDQEGKPKW
jgi:hypothetical protein